jgi:hypothetical protein
MYNIFHMQGWVASWFQSSRLNWLICDLLWFPDPEYLTNSLGGTTLVADDHHFGEARVYEMSG